MSDILLGNLIFVVLTAVLGLWLSFQVYFADRKAKINIWFFRMTIFICIWLVCGFLGSMYLRDPDMAVIALKINWAAVSFFFISAYFLSVYFPKEGKRRPLWDKITVLVWSLTAILSLFTSSIIGDIELDKFGDWGHEDNFGSAIDFFFLAVGVFTFLILYNLFKKYAVLSPKDKAKSQYLILGLSLFAFFNLIFNVALPIIRGNVQYYQFGDYSAVFIIFLTGYAIIKRDLFGIKVVLTAFLVGLIAILLFVDAFVLTQQFYFQLFKGMLLLVFLAFGYFLIKSVIKEIEQGKQLEKLNQKLDQKVKERTEELNARVTELEKFHRLTVGREVRMVELKKEIKKLEDKLEAE